MKNQNLELMGTCPVKGMQKPLADFPGKFSLGTGQSVSGIDGMESDTFNAQATVKPAGIVFSPSVEGRKKPEVDGIEGYIVVAWNGDDRLLEYLEMSESRLKLDGFCPLSQITRNRDGISFIREFLECCKTTVQVGWSEVYVGDMQHGDIIVPKDRPPP